MGNMVNNKEIINASEFDFEDAFCNLSSQCEEMHALSTALYFIIDDISSTEYYGNDILTLVNMQGKLAKSINADILTIQDKVEKEKKQ